MINAPDKKTDPEVIARLGSANENTVLQSIGDLHYSGSPQYIPVLGALLLQTPYEEVRIRILKLFGELKVKESAPYLIEMISDDAYLPYRKELLTACWQNGLDFSPWLSELVDWVIDNEMDIAFEAFTVIENLENFPDAGLREAEVIKINRALKNADSLKSYLLRELRGIIA